MQEFLKLLTARIMRSTFESHRLAVAMHLLRFLTPVSSSSANPDAARNDIATSQEWALLLTGAAVATPDGNVETIGALWRDAPLFLDQHDHAANMHFLIWHSNSRLCWNSVL
jgi:hypothetical protein